MSAERQATGSDSCPVTLPSWSRLCSIAVSTSLSTHRMSDSRVHTETETRSSAPPVARRSGCWSGWRCGSLTLSDQVVVPQWPTPTVFITSG